MLGISCLTRNTALLQDLKDLVEYIGYSQVAADKDAGVSNVYNIIRKSGIEVDLNTLGHIYNEVLPKTYKQFSSDEEVNDLVLANYNEAIKKAAALEDTTGEKQIGESAPEEHVVNGILNMFTQAYTKDQTTKSDMRQLQEALWKGIQRKLKLPDSAQPKTKESWKGILNKALGYEQVGVTDVNGKINGISDLYAAMKSQLAQASSDLMDKGDFDTVERWQEMTDKLQASSYNLLFSKGEAKDLLHGILKDAGFSKDLSNGKQIINWNKLAGGVGDVQDLRNNVDAVLSKAGFDAQTIQGVKDSLEDEFKDLLAESNEKNLKQLAAKDKAIGKITEQSSDLKRLSDLNNIGIFNGGFDRVLNNILKTSDLQQQDLADIKQLANAASELYREIDKKLGSTIFASRHLQTLQRSIDSIIARNINNKTVLLKTMSGMKNYFDVLLTGMLMRPFTILENVYSGVKAVIEPLIWGQGLKMQDFELYRKMLGDVAARGQAFGEEVGNFSPQELFTNSLKFKVGKDSPKTDIAKSILHAVMLPARIGLTGFDSANKVTITNSVFKNSIYKALTQNGKTKEESIKLINEALYGQSFDQAKKTAQEMIENINKKLSDKLKVPVNSRTITTFANDLVKANLNANGAINNDVIEAAYKSAYHVAGYGLGHEANNFISGAVRGYRNSRKQVEEKLIKEKDWNKLAYHRLKDTLTNGMVLRFIGGATNWVYLRFQGDGLGLATGFMGNWNRDIDFTDKRTIQSSLTDMQNRRNMIGRSIVGISATATAYLIGFALFHGEGGDEDKKKKLADLQEKRDKIAKERAESGEAAKKYKRLSDLDDQIKGYQKEMDVFKRIKDNWMGNRLFKKMSPDAMLFHYYLNTDKNTPLAILDYATQTTNFGSNYSASAKMSDAAKQYYKGETDAGNGTLLSIVGGNLDVPVWKSYKDWLKLGQWISGGTPKSDYKQPTTWVQGLAGGGMLEDIGLFKRNSAITMLPGIGNVAYEKFRAKGITTMEDIKKNPIWYKMKEKDGTYILDGASRVKAQKAAEKYFQEE